MKSLYRRYMLNLQMFLARPAKPAGNAKPNTSAAAS